MAHTATFSLRLAVVDGFSRSLGPRLCKQRAPNETRQGADREQTDLSLS